MMDVVTSEDKCFRYFLKISDDNIMMSGEDLSRQQGLGLGWREQLAPLHEERYDENDFV